MTTIDMGEDRTVELDETDHAVLKARIRDARSDVREIATETGIVANRVEDRLTRLESTGVIDGYTARIDYDKLGYDVTALFRLSVTDDSVLDRIRENPQFVAVYAVTGNEDVVAVGKFKDTNSMNAAVTDLLNDDGVDTLRTNVAMNVVREFEPFDPE
jgi:DNA-binding Lrp family transcriptional regulator